MSMGQGLLCNKMTPPWSAGQSLPFSRKKSEFPRVALATKPPPIFSNHSLFRSLSNFFHLTNYIESFTILSAFCCQLLKERGQELRAASKRFVFAVASLRNKWRSVCMLPLHSDCGLIPCAAVAGSAVSTTISPPRLVLGALKSRDLTTLDETFLPPAPPLCSQIDSLSLELLTKHRNPKVVLSECFRNALCFGI